ncbi:phage tail tape measure protein [Oceanobacillus indicireducens]|uniref:Phage tail tape measure protein domain-containing protein n=1 Tax=Oceanobacillus indicireducens TaxID=1004261 RepID=A0A917Y0C1_9BACI|nr:phage tail tape measure protein [Oceanobacillus indicireducens]GGN59303.1 hypothetical protein GCM10007971_22270 [Oceanobacillus indicireducens]
MSGRNLTVNLVANTSQFKSAMAETSNQIKTINSEFRNASAETDEYGNKLDNTGAKKKQLNGIIEQYQKRIQAITNEQKHWTSELEKGNITEEEHAAKQEELARRLNNTEAEMKKYEGQLKRLNSEGKDTRMTYEEFDRKFRDVGKTMATTGAAVGAATGVMFKGLLKIGKGVINTAAEFETGMSKVQALTGATGEEFEQLEGLAKDLGASTMFSATEAADAMSFLGMAGFDTNQIMEATPALLDLAASAQMDLGRAADITSNIISGFGYEAEDAGRIADVLAKSSSNANTNVEQMGDAMATVAPIASTLGMDIEGLASGVMIMSDAGIQGSQSGRMLRQGLIRLSKPTGEAEKLVKKLGINVFDADGNMKSLDGVVAELEKGLDGMSSQAQTAALATLFGSESTAGWSALLEQGSGVLADYTEDLENSEGAAADMAVTMQDNLQGSVTELKSAFEGLQIELGQQLIPYVRDGTDMLTEFTQGLVEMDDATLEAIAKTGLMATGVLGVTTAVAGLVAGIGALMTFAGPIGLALVGGTALVGALGTALFYVNEKTKAQEELSLDSAEALNDQAIELENTADKFDKLSSKAEISNSELARLYDLNEAIKKAKHPEEIAKLQGQFEELAKNSGLSKEELQELFDANDALIEQTPNIETSISDQGNAWVENTDAVREYIDSLHQATMVEMEAERLKGIEKEKELRKEIAQTQEDINYLIERQGTMTEAVEMSESEIRDRLAEIEELQRDTVHGSEEQQRLTHEHADLMNVLNGDYLEGVELLQDQVEQKRDSLEASEKELAKIEALDEGLADILLKRNGINETGYEGIQVLEETLAKNEEKLAKIEKEYEKNGELTEKQKEQQQTLVEQNEELRQAQQYINGELELYGSVNSLVESQKDKLSESTQEKIKSLEATHDIEVAEGNVVEQIQNKNSKLMEEREQLVKNREEQGANKEEIDKQIAAIDEKINTGEEVLLQMLEELDILELVKDGIQLNGDLLVEHLEKLGYTADEAYEIAAELSGKTVEALKEGTTEAGQAGKEKGKAHSDSLGFTIGDNKTSAELLVDGVDSELKKGNKNAQSHGKSKGDSHREGIKLSTPTNSTAARLLVGDVDAELSKGDGDARSHGKSKGDSHESGLSGTLGFNRTAALLISRNVTDRLSSTTDGGGGRTAGNQMRSGLLSRQGLVRTAGVTVATSGRSGLASVDTSSTGRNFVAGFSSSINDNNGSIWSRAWNLGKRALSALNSSIRTASPSKETEETGDNFVAGFAGAIDRGRKEAAEKASLVGKDALEGFNKGFEKYKQTIGGISLAIQDNKQVLKVEHEINNSGLENKISSLENVLEKLIMAMDANNNDKDEQSQQPIVMNVTVRNDEDINKIDNMLSNLGNRRQAAWGGNN